MQRLIRELLRATALAAAAVMPGNPQPREPKWPYVPTPQVG